MITPHHAVSSEMSIGSKKHNGRDYSLRWYSWLNAILAWRKQNCTLTTGRWTSGNASLFQTPRWNWCKCQFPTMWTAGLPSLTWTLMMGELSVSKSAQRLKHINIHKQTRNDTCQKVIQSKTHKKSKAKKSFLPLLSQLQQKFPPSHCFIIGIFL